MFGWLRKVVLILIAIILICSLIIMNFTLTLGISLKEDNIKEPLVEIIQEYSDVSYQQIPFLKTACQSQESIIINLPINSQQFTIKCSDVNTLSEEELKVKVTDQIFNDIYYNEYTCDGFLDCIKKENIFYFGSNQARSLAMKYFYYSLFFSIVLIALAVLLYENKFASLTFTGVMLIIAALPFLKLNLFFTWDFLPIQILALMLSKSRLVFGISFVIGIILIAARISTYIVMKQMKSKESSPAVSA
jgi:hypothetical protein